MIPWIARPTLDIDLDKSAADIAIPQEAMTAARRLLASVKEQIPPRAHVLAQLARIRTYYRFHREIVAMARLAGIDWRLLMLANLSYDLVLASLGCSTIALPTAQGPVLARNMDWLVILVQNGPTWRSRPCTYRHANRRWKQEL